jgi:hypothetical protein
MIKNEKVASWMDTCLNAKSSLSNPYILKIENAFVATEIDLDSDRWLGLQSMTAIR